MRNLSKRISLAAFCHLFILVTLLFNTNCSGTNGRANRHDADTHSNISWDSLKHKANNYLSSGEYDKLIISFQKSLREAEANHDTTIAIYSCAHIAQAYLFVENADSTQFYLNRVYAYKKKPDNANLNILLANIEGLYAVKFEMDFSKALNAFQRGYEIASNNEIENKLRTQITFLTNIGNIFYIRSDEQGLEYAKRAYALAQEESVDEYTQSLVNVSMAMMLQLEGRYNEAFAYVRRADSISCGEHIPAFRPTVDLLYANHYSQKGDFRRAAELYERAIADFSATDNGSQCLAYLNYGKSYERQGKLVEAIELYKKGLAISSKFGNVEFRKDFFHRISHLLYIQGQRQEAMKYIYGYWQYLDSISPMDQEKKFNRLMQSYQKVRYEYEIQLREIEIMQANRRSLIVIFVLVFILILFISIFTHYRKQRRMYHTLYLQHRKLMESERENAREKVQEKPSASNSKVFDEESGKQTASNKMDELFKEIELLMKHEKIYREKDISLTLLAERLNSNKTYISSAINQNAKQSFRDYVASYRIREAVQIISDPDNDTPLKQIADDLGFNFISVFNKTFCKETGLPPGQYRKEARGQR